jgi:hypothetical protein
MGYDETLASKIHSLLSAIGPCERSGMFGSVAFTVNGNIAAGVEDSSVFLRVGDTHAAELLKIQGVKPWPAGGRPMKGWVLLTPIAIGPTIVMRERLGWSYQCTGALPPKAVPKSAEPPRPPPPPAPPPEPVKKAAPRQAPRPKNPKNPPSPAATTVIAPGMARPLSPPTRIPFVPTVSKTVTPLSAARVEVGAVPRPARLPEKPRPKPEKETKPAKAKATKAAAPKPAARGTKQRRAGSKPAKSAARQVRGRPVTRGKKAPARKKTGKSKKR